MADKTETGTALNLIDDAGGPAPTTEDMALLPRRLSPVLAILLNPRLFARVKNIASILSKADGFAPPHLLGNAHACMAVVMRSMTWGLDPFAVAASTFTIGEGAKGKLGYEGKLVQAILEASGKIEGQIEREYFGKWELVEGKWTEAKSERGGYYARKDWNNATVLGKGVGITIRVKVIGEVDQRVHTLYLDQCFPLKSTLWATDPKTQIYYRAVRGFANTVMPSLFFGIPFDRDELETVGGGGYEPEPDAPAGPPPRPTRASRQRQAPVVHDVDEAGNIVAGATTGAGGGNGGDGVVTVQGGGDTQGGNQDEPRYELYDVAGEMECSLATADEWAAQLMTTIQALPGSAEAYLRNNLEQFQAFAEEMTQESRNGIAGALAALQARQGVKVPPADGADGADANPAPAAVEEEDPEPPKAFKPPMKDGRIDPVRYRALIVEEIMAAPTIDLIDRVIAREGPNMGSIHFGHRKAIADVVAERKRALREQGA